MTERNTIWIQSREIAELLGLSVATFRRSLDRLTERDGFPLPAAHRLKPMTWRRRAVEQWIESQCPDPAALLEVPPGSPDTGAEIHVLRLARAGG